MPNFWQIKVAWVPLPAPGAPNKISFMYPLELIAKCNHASDRLGAFLDRAIV
jgi:hypothetical protein